MTGIEFTDASFRYRRRERPVLDGFTLTVPTGRSIMLGPNGAGKSTILGLAASVLHLDRGRVTANGFAPQGRRGLAAYRKRVSHMPQNITAAAGLTTREQVALHGWLAGLSRSEAWDRSTDALARVDLLAHADRRAGKLSGGQRARMGLAQALVHSADVLLLDEPTAALDPDQRALFADLLADLADDRTVVVSSHDVADLQDSYEHVVVIVDGRPAFTGTTPEFLHQSGRALSPVEAYRTAVGVA